MGHGVPLAHFRDLGIELSPATNVRASTGRSFEDEDFLLAWKAPSQVLGLKTGLFRDFRKNGWAKLLRIVERERVVCPPVLFMIL
jgi:hypothetical protein